MRLSLLLIGAVLAASAGLFRPAAAQDAGILSLFGFGGEEKDQIEYLERAPLVVPKDMALPPPAEFDAKAAAWPKDPDELAAKRRKIERQKSIGAKAEDNIDFIRREKARRERKIANGEVQPGGIACALFGGCVVPDRPINSVQPQYVDPVLADGSPRRRYLTDPPDGLLSPAPPAPAGTN
jgi:hypothetical protein